MGKDTRNGKGKKSKSSYVRNARKQRMIENQFFNGMTKEEAKREAQKKSGSNKNKFDDWK